MQRSFSSNLAGKVRNFPLPKNHPLFPLYEAIVNSINAIEERSSKYGAFAGKIEIEVLRENTLYSESDENTVFGFSIQDNGIGFDETNMASFMEADSEHKMAIGGKGVGRFSWLKAFSSVHVSSTYKESDIFVTREFEFSLINQIEDSLKENPVETDYKTTIKLLGYKEEYLKNIPNEIKAIAIKIIQHCCVYFLSETCPSIEIYDENSKDSRISLNEMFAEYFSTEDNLESFNIRGQQFNLLNIKIKDQNFHHKNRLYLCANERLVESRDLEKIIINLDSQIFDEKKFWYLGILTGSYLDEHVDMNRLSFDIEQESSDLLLQTPGLQEIINVASDKIRIYLQDYLNDIEERKQNRIKKYITETAPQYRHLGYYVSEQLKALKPGISDEKLDDALYDIKRKFENETNTECAKLLKKLEEGTIFYEEYQQQFQETIKKVCDVNSAALAEYVVHRKIILNLFEKGLNIKSDGKFELEKYMHQLIYPMRVTSDKIPYEAHNLWLIDEKLSFCQFIASDKPFDNAQNEERTDILVLDNPVAVAENKNDGTVYNSIAIFELKRPMRDDYNMENNPITQLLDYAKKILDGKAKDSNHRTIKASTTTQFYLYALCDITPSLDRVLNSMSFTKTPDNLGAFSYNTNLNAYIEVLSFDKVRNDSEKRNRVLFDKLGVR